MHVPEISVVMPTYNDEAYIVQTIGSVLEQTFGDFELIIVDDASTDSTPSVIRNFDDKRIIFLENDSNKGPADTRNSAVRAARGRYIAFLDSDDLWEPNKLERQIDFMRSNGSSFTYSKYNIIDFEGTIYSNSGNIPSKATYHSILSHCFIRTSSVIYDSTLTGGKHYFPPIRKRQDFALFLSLLKAVDKADLIDDFLCSYRVRQNSVSSRKLKNISFQWSAYRSVEKLSLLYSVRLMIHWFVKAGMLNARRRISRLSMPRLKSGA
jgi:glycosyltransferase involved in cell wall biosynthesis